jgi:hypothetical protein
VPAAKSAWITDYCNSLRQSFLTVREVTRQAAGHSHVTGLLFLHGFENKFWPFSKRWGGFRIHW